MTIQKIVIQWRGNEPLLGGLGVGQKFVGGGGISKFLVSGGGGIPPVGKTLVGLGQSTGWGLGSSAVFLIQNNSFILNLIISMMLIIHIYNEIK